MVKKCERAIDTRAPGVTPLDFWAHAMLFFSHVVTRSVTLSLFFSILAWFNNGLKLYCSLFCGLGARFCRFFSFLLRFSYGVFCFFELNMNRRTRNELKELQKNSKLTLYQLKLIHFISLQINSISLQINFK